LISSAAFEFEVPERVCGKWDRNFKFAALPSGFRFSLTNTDDRFVQSMGEFFSCTFVADLHQSFAIKARASRAWLEC
jgi:hypothetical protein